MDAIVEYHPEAFGEDEPDDEEDEEIPLRQALTELIAGKFSDPEESAHQYGYALQELCDYLGDELGSWDAIRWAVLQETGMDKVLESGSPVRLPDNEGGFPAIGHLPRAEIPKRLEEVPPRLEAADEDWEPLYLRYQGWLEEATAAGRDLMFFYS